ncbi:LOW QUALITY PROTEIN: D-glutamate cyclase, mitochondrial [Dama dama]
MIFTFHLKSCLPSALRSLILQKKPNTRNMSNMSRGMPASVVVLPRPLALAFEKFCQASSGPLLLLGQSEPDKWTLPTLAHSRHQGKHLSSRVKAWEWPDAVASVYTGSLLSLSSEQLKDMVTFPGGSFSLGAEGLPAYKSGGVTITKMLGTEVSIATHGKCLAEHGLATPQTAVSCAIIAGFCCPLVITMMPAPKDKLGRLVQATWSMGGEQGQPIHSGNPELLGIKDLSKPDCGEVVVCQSGLVPVFWPSLLTSLEAVGSCETPLAFTRAPGCTVTTDLKGTATPARHLTPEGIPEIHRVSQDPLHHSMASASAIQRISELKVISAIDPGSGEIGELSRFDHLVAFEHAEKADYYNARKRNVEHVGDPIDDLFLRAHKIPGISSTGVSYKGNKLGMDKVKEAMKRYIRNGDILTCDMEADFAVIAAKCSDGQPVRRYLRKVTWRFRPPGEQNWTQALPSVTKEEKLLGLLVQHGVWNRLSGTLGTEV